MPVTDPETAPSGPDHVRDVEATLAAYTDLRYRDAFWATREYEDRCDRLALRALLPPGGGRLIEVGAGFGRLADEYGGFREVVLLDASEALLAAARQRLGADARFSMVRGDAFQLPFPDASFDAAVCVRVIHHFEDPRPAIAELARVLRPGGVLVLECANKRNLKAIALYVLRRQRSSPFARGSRPYEELSFGPVARDSATPAASTESEVSPEPTNGWYSTTSIDHAPQDLRAWLRAAGLRVTATRTVSLFRVPAISRRLPPGLLTTVERPLQALLAPVTPGPSLFFRAVRRPGRARSEPADPDPG